MMKITKNSNEPIALKDFRKEKCNNPTKKEDYDKFRNNCRSGFEDLQNTLLREQKNLCCYCMVKINRKDNKANMEKNLTIEHFLPKEKAPEYALEYSNLLACCDGASAHCGHSKGNKKLEKIPNPASSEGHLFILNLKYKPNGDITINDEHRNSLSETECHKISRDLNDILNLNNEILREARKSALQKILKKYNDCMGRKKGKISKEDFFEKLDFVSYHAFIKAQFLNK